MDATKRAMILADIVSLALVGKSQSWHQMNDEQFVHLTVALRQTLEKCSHRHTELEDFKEKLQQFSSTAIEN